MALIQRFQTIARGSMVLFGNAQTTSSDVGYPPRNPAVNGAYISTDSSLIAQSGFPAGTTFDPTLASSTGVLNMPAGSTVLYAQMCWAVISTAPTPSKSISLQLPNGSLQTISPDPALSQGVGLTLVHFQDVTSIMNLGGSGTYTVSGLPGPTLVNNTNMALPNGWWILLVYKNNSMPYRYFNLNTGLGIASTGSPSDFTFTGFSTPSTTPVNGYFLVSDTYGDVFDGTQVFIGTNAASATKIGNPSVGTWDGVAPYAQIDNMMMANILIADTNDPGIGLLDTRGTLGNNNVNPFNQTVAPYSRVACDIFGLDISSALTTDQTQLFTRVNISGSGASTAITSQSVQVDMNSANLVPMQKSVDKGYAQLSETLTYTVTFTNSGTASAQNVVFMDTLPQGVNFIPGTVTIDGTANPTANPALPGINLNPLSPNQTTTITFQVLTTATLPNPNVVLNNAQVTYTFVPGAGLPSEKGEALSNVATTTITDLILTSQKKVSQGYAKLGDTLSYAIVINATGNTSSNNTIITDTLPSTVGYVPNTFAVNGVTIPGASPLPPSGYNIGSLAVPGIYTVTFNAVVSTLPKPNPIINNAVIGTTYTVDPSVPNGGVKAIVTNDAVTTVLSVDLGNIKKVVDKSLATCGDTLVYTITIPNTGNTTATNVLFKDTIPAGTLLVTNSVFVNGVQQIGAIPSVGISLPDIGPGQMTTITFEVQIQC